MADPGSLFANENVKLTRLTNLRHTASVSDIDEQDRRLLRSRHRRQIAHGVPHKLLGVHEESSWSLRALLRLWLPNLKSAVARDRMHSPCIQLQIVVLVNRQLECAYRIHPKS